MALSPGEVAVAIRAASAADAVDASVATVLGFLLPAARAICTEIAPEAPEAVCDAAVIRLVGWLYEADPTDSRVSRAVEVSGAANLLQRYRVLRAGIVGAEGLLPAVSGIPVPPEDGHYILTSNDGELAWVAFPAP